METTPPVVGKVVAAPKSLCDRLCRGLFHVRVGRVVVEEVLERVYHGARRPVPPAGKRPRLHDVPQALAPSSGRPAGNCMTRGLRRLSLMRSPTARDARAGGPSVTGPIWRRLTRSSGSSTASAARILATIENAGGGDRAAHRRLPARDPSGGGGGGADPTRASPARPTSCPPRAAGCAGAAGSGPGRPGRRGTRPGPPACRGAA